MINNIINIAIIIALFLFLSNTKVTIKPFSIKISNWISAITALVAMFIFLFFLGYKEQKSYEKGWKEGAEYVISILENNRKKTIHE